ncbi:MAG: PDZ domain-containing protein [Gammaproteobacteria bacterium]
MSIRSPLYAALLALAAPLAVAAADAPQKSPQPQAEDAELERARAELRRAQQDLARAAKELARVTREHKIISPRAYAYEFLTDPDRAMLGVTIGDEAKQERRCVLITGVTPGSGADKAGLKSGDLLLSANGTRLAGAGGDERRPVERLRDVMNGLKPGDPVAIEYERDGKRATATVTASRPQHAAPLPMFGWTDDEDFDLLIPPAAPLPPGAPLALHLHHDDAGLQLARLDDDLAAYFDTKDGVLVVRAPEGGTLALKSGDVIRRINGRSVASPVAAWEELGDADGELTMDVLRRGKTLTLRGTLPERRKRRIAIGHPDTP